MKIQTDLTVPWGVNNIKTTAEETMTSLLPTSSFIIAPRDLIFHFYNFSLSSKWYHTYLQVDLSDSEAEETESALDAKEVM